jgi:hypothetical protein
MEKKIVIDKIRKTSGSEVWILLDEYDGRYRCDVREYFRPDDGPKWLPTKKGVGIPIELLGQAVDAAKILAERSKNVKVGEVTALQRGNKAKISFGIGEFNKHFYGEIRTYYRTDESPDTWKHGKGVTLPLAMLNKLVEALRLAEDQSEHLNLKGDQ